MIDTIVAWFQVNAAGIVVGLLLWVIFLVVIADHVERQNNLPRQ